MTDPTSPTPPEQPADEADITRAAATGLTTPTIRSNARAWAIGGIALVIALGVGGAVLATSGNQAKPAGAMASTGPSTTPPTTAAPTSAAPTTNAPTSAAPTKTTPPPKPKPPSYKTLSARQWKLIAKNPDAHLGEHYVVYGRVTQFDAATGTDTFRADIAHRRMPDEFDYETNTMLSGTESDLENLVEDDIFRANVMVLGSYSYDTQIGGQTTVPLLQVDSIKVL